jgi:hypothetical protein
MLQRKILPPSSSGLKKEAACFSTMLVSTYKFTWCYNPENQYQHVSGDQLFAMLLIGLQKLWGKYTISMPVY